MPFNRGTIKHSGGRNKTKHGLSLRDLPSFLQTYLHENNQFKEIEDDKVFEILFKMKELEFRGDFRRKIYYCPFTLQPATLEEITQNAEKTHFNCFHCKKEIAPYYNVFTYRNLTCDTCYHENADTYDKPEFSKCTEHFRESVSEVLTEERKLLIKYIKRNSKS